MKLKTAIPLGVSGLIFLSALAVGWQHYQSEPMGDLLYSAANRCPQMANSFATGYLLVLLLCGFGTVLIVVSSFLASVFVRKPDWSLQLKEVAMGGLMVVALLASVSLFSYFANALFPLQIRPGCGPA